MTRLVLRTVYMLTVIVVSGIEGGSTPDLIAEARARMGHIEVVESESHLVGLTCTNSPGPHTTYTWETEGYRTLAELDRDIGWQTGSSHQGNKLTIEIDSSSDVKRMVFYCLDDRDDIVNVIDLIVSSPEVPLIGRGHSETNCHLYEGYLPLLSCEGSSRRRLSNCLWFYMNETSEPIPAPSGATLVPRRPGRYRCECQAGVSTVERTFIVEKAVGQSPRTNFFCEQLELPTVLETTVCPGATETSSEISTTGIIATTSNVDIQEGTEGHESTAHPGVTSSGVFNTDGGSTTSKLPTGLPESVYDIATCRRLLSDYDNAKGPGVTDAVELTTNSNIDSLSTANTDMPSLVTTDVVSPSKASYHHDDTTVVLPEATDEMVTGSGTAATESVTTIREDTSIDDIDEATTIRVGVDAVAVTLELSGGETSPHDMDNEISSASRVDLSTTMVPLPEHSKIETQRDYNKMHHTYVSSKSNDPVHTSRPTEAHESVSTTMDGEVRTRGVINTEVRTRGVINTEVRTLGITSTEVHSGGMTGTEVSTQALTDTEGPLRWDPLRHGDPGSAHNCVPAPVQEMAPAVICSVLAVLVIGLVIALIHARRKIRPHHNATDPEAPVPFSRELEDR